MTVEQGASERYATIRIPRHALVLLWVQGGLFLTAGTFFATTDQSILWRLWQFLGIVAIAQAIWSRFFGVDLTPQSVKLGGVLRRSVPWAEVQEVIRYDGFRSKSVRLVLKSGRPVKLRAPSMMWGMGSDQFERDFHLIQQWSLAHQLSSNSNHGDVSER